MNYLSEAFKKLDFLNEDDFSLDNASDIDDMSQFLSVERDPVQDVIDPEAESEEELEDTYIGKVILHCPVCNSMVYKDLEDIERDDEEELVNVGEECPYCYTSDGFEVIGIVSPFKEESEKEEEVEASDESEADENGEGADEVEVDDDVVDESLKEDFEHVEVATDEQKLVMDAEEDGKITIESEPVANEADIAENEFIQPVPDPVKDEIEAPEAEETAEVETEEEIPFDDGEVDYDIDDFDEESFDGLGEAYLKKVYDNVASYKTSNVSMKDNSLVVEGVITFNSGKTRTTNFIFEAKTATKGKKLCFIGENKQITRGRKAFTITGTLNESKSFITEKFNYNYMAKNSEGKSKRLYGTLK